MEGAGAPVTVLGAQGVEDTQQAGDLLLEGARGLAACVEVAAEGSCCSLVADRLAPSWVAGSWKEEEEGGPEVVLQAVDRREGDMAVLGARSSAASGRRRDLPSSSWTAGSGSLLQTCRSWWWT